MEQFYLFSINIMEEDQDAATEIKGISVGTCFASVMARIEEQYGPILLGVNYLTPCFETCDGIAELSNAAFTILQQELEPLAD